MEEYKDRKIINKQIDSDAEIKSKKFIKCNFDDCVLSFPYNVIPEERTKMIDCVFEDCEFSGRSCSQKKGYLKNVLFDNIKNLDFLRIGGVIFEEVTFKGKFDKWLLSSSHISMVINYNSITEEECTVLDEYAQKQYKNIKWALDISEAEFKECDLRSSIPARLIKYNPETQMLIKYDKVLKSDWRNNNKIMSCYGGYAEVFCKRVLRHGSDTVVVASVRNKKEFEKDMEAIKILRAEGIAEPD